MIFAKTKSWCGAMTPGGSGDFYLLQDVLLTTTAHIAPQPFVSEYRTVKYGKFHMKTPVKKGCRGGCEKKIH
jgi:hypothetical protein